MSSEKQRKINQCLGSYDGTGRPKVGLASDFPKIDPDIVAWHEQIHRNLEEASTTGWLLRLCALILKVGRCDLPIEISKQMDELIASLYEQTAFVHEGLATYIGLIFGAGDASSATRALSVLPPFYQKAAQACALAFGSFDQVFGNASHFHQVPLFAFDVGRAALNIDLLNLKFDINDLSPIRDRVSADTPDSRFSRFLLHLDPPDRPGPLGAFLAAPENVDMLARDDRPVSFLDPYPQVTQRLFSLLKVICPDVQFVSDRTVVGCWTMEIKNQAMEQLESMGCEFGKRIHFHEVDKREHEVTFIDAGVPDWMPLDRSLWQTRYPEKPIDHFIEFCRQCASHNYILHIFLWPAVLGNNLKLEDNVKVVANIRAQKDNPSQSDPPASIDVNPFSVVLDYNSISDALARYPELNLTLRTDERFVKDPKAFFGRWPVPSFVLMRHTSFNHISETLSSLARVSDVCILRVILESQPAVLLKPKGSTVYYATPTTHHIYQLVLDRFLNPPNVVLFDHRDRLDEFGINLKLAMTILCGCYVGLHNLDWPMLVLGSMTGNDMRELMRGVALELKEPS